MPCPPLIKRCYAIIITIEKGGKNMPRKHFELNSDVNKLIEKYDEINNVDFNKLVNKALRFYLVNQMNYKDVQDALITKLLSILMKQCVPAWVILIEIIRT